MNNFTITAILTIIGSVALANHKGNTPDTMTPTVAPYRELGVPEHLEPVYSWPLGNVYECDGLCIQAACPAGQHVFLVDLPPGRKKLDKLDHGAHEECESGYCAVTHSQCDPDDLAMTLSDVEMVMIWETATTGGPAALADLRGWTGKEVVTYNISRKAIQVRGCDGSMIMSIPLPGSQAAAAVLGRADATPVDSQLDGS